MARESKASQIIFRGIFLLFFVGGDIVSLIKEQFPTLTESGSESSLALIIALVFLGPLLLFLFFSKFKKLFTNISSTMEAEMIQNQKLQPRKKDVNSMYTDTDRLVDSNLTQTVTGEKVSPFSLDGRVKR